MSLIPAPRHPEEHAWRFAEFHEDLIEAFRDELLADMKASRTLAPCHLLDLTYLTAERDLRAAARAAKAVLA